MKPVLPPSSVTQVKPGQYNINTSLSTTPTMNQSLSSAAEKIAKTASSKTNLTQSFDMYDYVLGYLLDEGYADTLDSAENILENMSEDWIDEVLDEAYVKIKRKNTERQIRRLGTASATASSPGKSDQYSGMAGRVASTYLSHQPGKKGKPSEEVVKAKIAELINRIRGSR